MNSLITALMLESDVNDIRREACRISRSPSWVVQVAWRIAGPKVAKIYDVQQAALTASRVAREGRSLDAER